ncbi:MAG: hypothetical protein NZ890_12640 [Myxococcota bacterium]|nr:hypothetical protein [Myxococcota bacterium]
MQPHRMPWRRSLLRGGLLWVVLCTGCPSEPTSMQTDGSALMDPPAIGDLTQGNDMAIRPCTLTSTWTTVDDYFPPNARDNSYGTAIAQDPAGALFVFGGYNDSMGSYHWYVRRSQNGGATWTLIDDFQLVAGKSTSPGWSIGVLGAGQVVVTGDAKDATNRPSAVTRRTANGGMSWTTDVYQYPGGQDSTSSSVYVGSAGSVYLMGGGKDGSGKFHWLVRQSVHGGDSYSILDDYLHPDSITNIARAAVEQSPGVLYVLGTRSSAAGLHWVVRASTGAGGSFVVEDDFQLVPGKDCYPRGIWKGPGGSLFALGWCSDATGKYHGIVRRRQGNPPTWTTVDDFQLVVGHDSQMSGIAADSQGALYLVGAGRDRNDIFHALIRRSVDGGSSFATIDDFQLVAGKHAYWYGVIKDQQGNLYVVGGGTNAQDRWHSLVRKLACN